MKFIKRLFAKSELMELDLALNYVHENFVSNDINSNKNGSCVKIFNQPEIYVTELDSWKHESQENWLAHGVIEFRLNPENPDSWVVDCATGIGESKEEAIRNFVDNWFIFTAPAPLSLLRKEASFDAVLLSPDDADGFPGWEGFSGPFLLRGSDERKNKLVNFLRENPLLPKLADILEPDFPAPMLVGIRIFWGHSGNAVDARVAINDQEHKMATDKLIEMMSDFAVGGEFSTVGQFILLLQKVEVENT